jgi:hypothetical protein
MNAILSDQKKSKLVEAVWFNSSKSYVGNAEVTLAESLDIPVIHY